MQCEMSLTKTKDIGYFILFSSRLYAEVTDTRSESNISGLYSSAPLLHSHIINKFIVRHELVRQPHHVKHIVSQTLKLVICDHKMPLAGELDIFTSLLSVRLDILSLWYIYIAIEYRTLVIYSIAFFCGGKFT